MRKPRPKSSAVLNHIASQTESEEASFVGDGETFMDRIEMQLALHAPFLACGDS